MHLWSVHTNGVEEGEWEGRQASAHLTHVLLLLVATTLNLPRLVEGSPTRTLGAQRTMQRRWWRTCGVGERRERRKWGWSQSRRRAGAAFLARGRGSAGFFFPFRRRRRSGRSVFIYGGKAPSMLFDRIQARTVGDPRPTRLCGLLRRSRHLV
jgi:hypothetical protein